MLYFMKPLPKCQIDTTEWKPFIKNPWFRNHFMYFVYCLQGALLLTLLNGVENGKKSRQLTLFEKML